MALKIAIGHGQSCSNSGHIAMLLDCLIEILHVSGYSDTSYIYLLANIVALLSQN